MPAATSAVTRTALVIPCFNEADRLDLRQIQKLLDETEFHLIFVNDGSIDRTWQILVGLRAQDPARVELIGLMINAGKAEAVRRGMLRAIEVGASVVGFADADFATPTRELIRLHQRLIDGTGSVVLGSRLMRLGAEIVRSSARHYVGRVFATCAALIIGMEVYDTQCGAKFFRASKTLDAALADPFISRWAFDVELLARLRIGCGQNGYRVDDFFEVPLETWIDMEGSKLTFLDKIKVSRELILIWLAVRRLRENAARAVPK